MKREKIEPEFREKLEALAINNSETLIKALVELDESGRHLLFDLTKKNGSSIQINHSYKNLPTVALEAKAEVLLQLSEEKWVERIDEDQEIHINPK